MTCISRKVISGNPDGSETVRAFIVSNDTPTTLPTTGAGITGLNSTDKFAPMSILFVVGTADTKTYITNEDGEFVGQSQG